MTYSIIARDPEAGEIGVAVQSCWPAVGAVVPWLEPGVGAIATQSFTNVGLGPRGLDLLRSGLPAPDVLRDLVASDPSGDVRQVGVVDAAGRSAAHTGDRCVAEAGHVCEPDVAVQANMLERTEAPSAMSGAYRAASGDLADRLMAALRAGEREGGDIRGKQSAALLVAPGSATAQPWARRFDVRVDDSPRPLDELERLLGVARAYEALDAAIDAIEVGELEAALESTTLAHRHAPKDAQIAFWHAVVLDGSGRADEAGPILEAALRSEPRLAEFGSRYVDAGRGAILATALDRGSPIFGGPPDPVRRHR